MSMLKIQKNLSLRILIESVGEDIIRNILSPFLRESFLLNDVYLDIFDCEYAIKYELDYMKIHPDIMQPYWFHNYGIYHITTSIDVGVSDQMQNLWGLNIIPIIESIAKLISEKASTIIVIEFVDWESGNEIFIPYKIYANGVKIVDCYDKYNHLFNNADWIPCPPVL